MTDDQIKRATGIKSGFETKLHLDREELLDQVFL